MLLSILLTLGIATIITTIIIYSTNVSTFNNNSGKRIKMSFENFMALCNINSNVWHCRKYNLSRGDREYSTDFYVIFGVIDYIKYQHWYKHQKKIQKCEEEAKDKADILRIIQKDVDKYKEKGQ